MVSLDGKVLRQDFLLEPGYVAMNHGSYGTYPRSVQQEYRKYQEKNELFPDRWMRLEMYAELQKSRKLLAGLLHCDPNDLVFSHNASSAANTILRSFPFEKGDKILYYTTGYINVNKTLEYIQNTLQVELVPVDLPFPLSHADIVTKTAEAIDEANKAGGKPIRMALYDVLSSLPGVLMPYEALEQLFKSRDILTIADGAHSIGQVPINLENLDPDFYFTNCHKWLFVPRGFAVLYVKKCHQGLLHPQTVNSAYIHHVDGADNTSFEKEFAVWSTAEMADFSPFLIFLLALKYRESLGGEEVIMAHNHDLAVRGGALVAKILNTKVLENDEGTLTAAMVNVELPITNTTTPDAELASIFMKKVIYDHHVMAPAYKLCGKWYVRLCAQVYVTLDDFETTGHALAKVCEEINNL
ncbi:pyridoxal phosphate-dependent transferase [Gongronella butleri]|nr:pyridoxal phosphate-dependent transferase [Gongronella butleri]